MSRIAHVDGQYRPHREAAVHIEDRAYQFADGVYEVIAVAGRALVDTARHFTRLAFGYLQITRGLVTRQTEQAIRNGLTRSALFDIMRREGYRLIEQPFTRAEAKPESEAFLTSATAELLSVVRVGGDPVGEGRPGPLTDKLRAAYLARAAAPA
jgi:branched-subunit amino acid aminotransferase/4-amino-4-deoxychorismate lyase